MLRLHFILRTPRGPNHGKLQAERLAGIRPRSISSLGTARQQGLDRILRKVLEWSSNDSTATHRSLSRQTAKFAGFSVRRKACSRSVSIGQFRPTNFKSIRHHTKYTAKIPPKLLRVTFVVFLIAWKRVRSCGSSKRHTFAWSRSRTGGRFEPLTGAVSEP